MAEAFGSQCVVVGIDATPPVVYSHTGDVRTMRAAQLDVFSWVTEVVRRGAGEIVMNCMHRDGTGEGFDGKFLAQVRAVCPIPLVASGGAGTAQHFAQVFRDADVDAALAAGALHRGELTIPEIKVAVSEEGFEVRR